MSELIQIPHSPPCPQTGGGVHTWILGEARRLSFRLNDPDKIAKILRKQVKDCGRPVPDREIFDAVRKVLGTGPKIPTSFLDPRISSRDRILDRDTIDQLVEAGPDLKELIEASPDPLDLGAEAYIDALFDEEELICVATGHPRTARTCPRSELRGELGDTSHLVPSPMSSIKGKNQEGKPSSRCLDNTGPRRFLIVEGDGTTQDEQAAVLWHLNALKPLALVVDSGGKSLHGWFPAWDEKEEDIQAFHRYACSLGGDPATLTRCQLVRTPGGLRSTTGQAGVRQEVKFFNRKEAAAWR